MTALQLFRVGKDTVDIAKELGITEAAASFQVYMQRSAELKRPAHYERPTQTRRQA